jgi:hypothetical protein
MQNNYALKDKTLAELEADLTSYEQAYAFGDIPKSEYLKAKALLQDAIIDKHTGPIKRTAFDLIKPYLHRLDKSEREGMQPALRFCRSVSAVKAWYEQWQGILRFRKIADLPDLDKPKPNQIRNAA